MSIVRKQKYLNIKKIYKFFDSNKNDIVLFSHINDLDINENFLMRSYCKDHNIKILYIKGNLMKKITVNNYFRNLVTGPTILFSFKDCNSFLSFYNFFHNKQKFVPLSVY